MVTYQSKSNNKNIFYKKKLLLRLEDVLNDESLKKSV